MPKNYGPLRILLAEDNPSNSLEGISPAFVLKGIKIYLDLSLENHLFSRKSATTTFKPWDFDACSSTTLISS